MSSMPMHGSRKFCQRGSKFDKFFFFLVDEGRIKKPLKAGHHRPTSETPFKWRFARMVMMAGLVAL